MNADFKDAVVPSDVVAALADRQGICRWLVFNLTGHRAAAMTTHPERRLMTTLSIPGRPGALYLTRSIVADGFALCTERAATADGLAQLLDESGITEADILRAYAVARIKEDEQLHAQVFGTAQAISGEAHG